MVALLKNFGSKSLFDERKFVHNINENPNSPQTDKLSIPNSYKVWTQFVYSNELVPYPLEDRG
jgi:hypothetical protein